MNATGPPNRTGAFFVMLIILLLVLAGLLFALYQSLGSTT